jgi:hypothetical protein
MREKENCGNSTTTREGQNVACVRQKRQHRVTFSLTTKQNNKKLIANKREKNL